MASVMAATQSMKRDGIEISATCLARPGHDCKPDGTRQIWAITEGRDHGKLTLHAHSHFLRQRLQPNGIFSLLAQRQTPALPRKCGRCQQLTRPAEGLFRPMPDRLRPTVCDVIFSPPCYKGTKLLQWASSGLSSA